MCNIYVNDNIIQKQSDIGRNGYYNRRNEELLQLDAIIASAEANSAERAEALSMKIDLTEITETELLLESLIKAYGFEDAVDQ